MVVRLLEWVSGFLIATISALGYPGVVLLMAIESACIPLPSEIILPFSGYLVYQGRLNLWGVAFAGAIGCVLGSVPAYYAGRYGGRPFIERYGRFVLISRHDLDWADRWFTRYGNVTVFFARLLPVIRTFIAFPAGVARMPMPVFLIYTFIGSFPWSLTLAYAGLVLGSRWPVLREYVHRFDAVIGVVLVVAIGVYVWRHVRGLRPGAQPESIG